MIYVHPRMLGWKLLYRKTKELELRLAQHQAGIGANHTSKRLPVKLVYIEEYERIDDAFYREKQVQGWRREKKEALISGKYGTLPELALSRKMFPSTGSGNDTDSGVPTSSENGTK